MKVLIKFIFRCAFLAFTIPALTITASMEYMRPKPDWEYWREFNGILLACLPWAPYIR